jgi:hypothetical protein
MTIAACALGLWAAVPTAHATEAAARPGDKQRSEAAAEGVRSHELALRKQLFGSFTPSILAPSRLPSPAVRAGTRSQLSEQSFRFTPAGAAAPAQKKSIALEISSRVAATPSATAATTAQAPDIGGYGVDVEVGYRGFTLFGGYNQLDLAIGRARHEELDVGLGYRGADWRTSLQFGREEQRFGLTTPDLAARYSVELGGAYEVAPRLLLSGGVRYKLSPDGELTRFEDDRPDSSIFLSTALSF